MREGARGSLGRAPPLPAAAGLGGGASRGGASEADPPREERTPARSDDVMAPVCASARARSLRALLPGHAGSPDARRRVCVCALPLGLLVSRGRGIRSLGSCKLHDRGLASQTFLLQLRNPDLIPHRTDPWEGQTALAERTRPDGARPWDGPWDSHPASCSFCPRPGEVGGQLPW